MKIKLPVHELRNTVDRVMGVVARRSTLPILSHVLIDVVDTSLTVTASNSETEASATVAITGKVAEAGRICLEAAKLSQLLKSLNGEDMVTLALTDGDVKMSCGRSKFKIKTMPPDLFPYVDTASEDWQVRDLPVDTKELLSCIARVSFAQGVNDVRTMLNGMLLERTNNELRFVSTDGHRLATTKLNVAGEGNAACIIPRRVVDQLAKLIGKAGDQVLISMSANKVEVKTEEIRIVTGVIEGKFPAYERVIPSPDKLPLKARISRADLMTTLKLSLITADEMSRRLNLIFDDGLTVTSTNAEQEQSTLKVPVEWQKDPMTIHVNGGYLTDALKAVEGDECEINMGENQHVVTIRSQVDPNFTCVVMQMSR